MGALVDTKDYTVGGRVVLPRIDSGNGKNAVALAVDNHNDLFGASSHIETDGYGVLRKPRRLPRTQGNQHFGA